MRAAGRENRLLTPGEQVAAVSEGSAWTFGSVVGHVAHMGTSGYLNHQPLERRGLAGRSQLAVHKMQRVPTDEEMLALLDADSRWATGAS